MNKLNGLNIILITFSSFVFSKEQVCDTLRWGSEIAIECIKSNCPYDSTVTFYRPDSTTSITTYLNCGDEGIFVVLASNSDTLSFSHLKHNKSIGLRRIYYSANHPQQFTNFNNSNQQDGWEVLWYPNGNIKDSILFRNDSTIQRTTFFYNGKVQMRETHIYGDTGYCAVSYNPKGIKTGEIKNGTGTVFVYDSVGGNFHKLVYKNRKRVFD
jgi:antitoxin component YwqK of YwqJK toxin-antitoxin module